MSKNHFIAIMAGGIGSRFWPASREGSPKQFLDITGSGLSLLQQTVKRLQNLVPIENILIVSNKSYAGLILTQLPAFRKEQLLLEPVRNNTAPCVAYTALHLQAINPDAVFAVVPADHIIKKEKVFISAMTKGFKKAEKENAIVTLGIQPTRPDTGYGYIEYDPDSEVDKTFKVRSFKEKPSLLKAQEYLSSGDFVWNAGIFIWSCQTILNNFKQSSKQIINVLSRDISKYGTSEEEEYINQVYPLTESISVDYAILEKANNVFTIPVDIGWSDLGTWNSLYSYMEKDQDQNVILSKNNKTLDTRGNLIRVKDPDKLIVVKGLEDYIIIDEGDVLLIYPREDEQEIKQIKTSLDDKRFE